MDYYSKYLKYKKKYLELRHIGGASLNNLRQQPQSSNELSINHTDDTKNKELPSHYEHIYLSEESPQKEIPQIYKNIFDSPLNTSKKNNYY